jgi:hypothetical protein
MWMKATFQAMEHFKNLGICERIAWFKGSSNLVGTGWPVNPGSDWPDEANPFGTNAWFLYRFPPNAGRSWPWYLHFQVSGYTINFGAVDHPALINGGVSNRYNLFGWQIARGIGSTASIWNGTTNNDGTDIKGSEPYWKIPAGGTRVAVLPRSNGLGGAHAASKKNMGSIVNSDSYYPYRVSFLTDGDAVVCVFSDNAGSSYGFSYLGAIVEEPDMKSAGGVMAMITNNSPPISVATDFGPINGLDLGGGMDLPGDQERMARIDRLQNVGAAGTIPTYSPSKVWTPGPNRMNLCDIPLLCSEAYQGIVGTLSPALVRETYNHMNHTMDGNLRRAVLGSSSAAQPMMALAWDGASVPGTNATRAGIDFQL